MRRASRAIEALSRHYLLVDGFDVPERVNTDTAAWQYPACERSKDCQNHPIGIGSTSRSA